MTTTKRARCLVGRNILGNRKFMVKEQIEKRGYVIITGGTSGIGLAAAQCLQAIGYQSILLGRDKIRGLEAVKKVIGSTYLFCDVTDTLSIKKAISDNPMNDHAIVATFWFKEGQIFVKAAEKMIKENERVNNEFYVDSVISHVIDLGYTAKVFEIERYIGWGTPKDYEEYQNTVKYWKEFVQSKGYLGE